MIKLKIQFWLLTKYVYWHDVLFTLVDNTQLRLWNRAVEMREEVDLAITLHERYSDASVDSWDDLDD